MIPPSSHPRWAKLVSGEIEVPSSNLSFNMLVFQVRLQWNRQEAGGTMDPLIDRTREFLRKYENLLQPEIAALFPEH